MYTIEYAEDGVEVSHNDVGFQSAVLEMLDVEMSQKKWDLRDSHRGVMKSCVFVVFSLGH